MWADRPVEISYSFVSDTADESIPEEIDAYLESEDLIKAAVSGTEITLPSYEDYEIEDEGVWAFKGWKQGEETVTAVTVGTEDIALVGHWEYTPEQHE